MARWGEHYCVSLCSLGVGKGVGCSRLRQETTPSTFAQAQLSHVEDPERWITQAPGSSNPGLARLRILGKMRSVQGQARPPGVANKGPGPAEASNWPECRQSRPIFWCINNLEFAPRHHSCQSFANSYLAVVVLSPQGWLLDRRLEPPILPPEPLGPKTSPTQWVLVRVPPFPGFSGITPTLSRIGCPDV
jgi:hypothetical protein